MSNRGYASHDSLKEPHSVSVKVLRLSRPSLVPQYPSASPLFSSSSPSSPLSSWEPPPPIAGSLAYQTSDPSTNPDPFLLSPILNLPVSFGSAYVGETFSCTLCANNECPDSTKNIRNVRITAEMKTPGHGAMHSLDLGSDEPSADLQKGETLQKVVSFDLKEEGNHVLAVTVSYYEASETSGRTRTFRKLYQFICKASLIVRTKAGLLVVEGETEEEEERQRPVWSRRWVLEAQLENCSEEVMQLEKVAMEMEKGLTYQDCNWEEGGDKPILQPGEVEQVCFVVNEEKESEERGAPFGGPDGRIVFGVLGIGWRGEMGNRGFLSTGKLGTRIAA